MLDEENVWKCSAFVDHSTILVWNVMYIVFRHRLKNLRHKFLRLSFPNQCFLQKCRFFLKKLRDEGRRKTVSKYKSGPFIWLFSLDKKEGIPKPSLYIHQWNIPKNHANTKQYAIREETWSRYTRKIILCPLHYNTKPYFLSLIFCI